MSTSNNIISFRRHDLDNLRTSLTTLVILHHTSITYGGPGSGSYVAPWASTVTPLSLLIFNGFNQSFFMGSFFWMGARNTAQALADVEDKYKRKSKVGFLEAKVKRLGLPVLAYITVMQPLVRLAALPTWTWAAAKQDLAAYFKNYGDLRGPMWYVGTQLLMDLIAAGLSWSTPFSSTDTFTKSAEDTATEPTPVPPPKKSPSWWYSLLSYWGWIPVGLASFLVRTRYPVGKPLPPLNIQPAYAPQYILAYILGFMSEKQGLTRQLGPFNRSDGKELSLAKATALSLGTVPLVFIPLLLNPSIGLSGFNGGWNWVAFAYAMWNEFSFAMVGPALMAHAGKWRDQATSSGAFQARYAYGAFLAHMLVSTLVESVLDHFLLSIDGGGWVQTKVWKFVGSTVMTSVVGLLNSWLSFKVSKFFVEKVPGFDQVI